MVYTAPIMNIVISSMLPIIVGFIVYSGFLWPYFFARMCIITVSTPASPPDIAPVSSSVFVNDCMPKSSSIIGTLAVSIQDFVCVIL